jgi:hypothetical protein
VYFDRDQNVIPFSKKMHASIGHADSVVPQNIDIMYVRTQKHMTYLVWIGRKGRENQPPPCWKITEKVCSIEHT